MASDESQQQMPGKGAQQEETPFQVLRPDKVLPDPVVTTLRPGHATRYLGDKPQDYFPSVFAPPRETIISC